MLIVDHGHVLIQGWGKLPGKEACLKLAPRFVI